MAQANVKVSENDLKFLYNLLVDVPAPRAKDLVKRITAAVGTPPVHCHSCRAVQASEAEYAAHLIADHHYRDDEYGDDTSGQVAAWNAFHAGSRYAATWSGVNGFSA